MSLYQLHKALFAEVNGAPTPDEQELRAAYELTDTEVAAVLQTDIAALYRLGVHPVMINSFSRARRVPRDAYRDALASITAE